MPVEFVRHEIPGPPTWPYRTHGRYAVTAAEEEALSRAARLPHGRIWYWLDPFNAIVIAPDRLPQAIAELMAGLEPSEPSRDLARMRGRSRAVDFLACALEAAHYVEVLVDDQVPMASAP